MDARRPDDASTLSLELTARVAAAVIRGHPWVYREGIARVVGDGARTSGAVAGLVDPQGNFVGRGLWDCTSPIAVRMISLRRDEPVDAALLAARLSRACERRLPWFDDPSVTNAYRLCNGEGDRVPGLVVDKYADFAVVRTDGAAIEPWVARTIAFARGSLEAIGIRGAAWQRAARRSGAPRSGGRHSGAGEPGAHGVEPTDRPRLEPLFGPPPPDSLLVRENGWTMVVDLARGQKTGAFFDQRQNRARVRGLSAGRRVLNLFSYAGGFSLAAALGSAAHVTSVDIAQGAHATAQRSFRENGLDPAAHAFVTADAFAFLESARAAGRRWDLIISDPPSFAPNERSVPRALSAYRRLHRACAEVLAEGGIFCAASCSSHVPTTAFLGTLDDAALGRSDLSIRAVHGAPPDHPVVAGWPEGLYLKFVVLS